MRGLLVAVALGWFWITFYAVGPVTGIAQVAEGAMVLVAGTLLSMSLGVLAARRRSPPTSRPSGRR